MRDQIIRSSCQPSAHLFALTHEEAEHFFIGALERGAVEPENIGRHNDKHRAGKDDHNALWRSMRGVKVERHKTCMCVASSRSTLLVSEK